MGEVAHRALTAASTAATAVLGLSGRTTTEVHEAPQSTPPTTPIAVTASAPAAVTSTTGTTGAAAADVVHLRVELRTANSRAPPGVGHFHADGHPSWRRRAAISNFATRANASGHRRGVSRFLVQSRGSVAQHGGTIEVGHAELGTGHPEQCTRRQRMHAQLHAGLATALPKLTGLNVQTAGQHRSRPGSRQRVRGIRGLHPHGEIPAPRLVEHGAHGNPDCDLDAWIRTAKNPS